jgi:hypothetical protein
MWAVNPQTLWQPTVRLDPVDGTTADLLYGVSNGVPDFFRYAWAGTLRAQHSHVGALHLNAWLPSFSVWDRDGLGYGADNSWLEVRFGAKYVVRIVKRFEVRTLANFEQLIANGGRTPYASNLLNPAPTTLFNSGFDVVAVYETADCIMYVNGAEVRKKTLASSRPIWQFGSNSQRFFLSAGFCRVQGGVQFYFNGFQGGKFGVGSFSVSSSASENDCLDGPVDIVSYDGAIIDSIALRPGIIENSLDAIPDTSSDFGGRYGSTFAAYRHRALNFTTSLVSNSSQGIADVDCAGNKFALNAGGQFACAIAGYDLWNTAFLAVAGDTQSNVGPTAVENSRLSQLDVIVSSNAFPRSQLDLITGKPPSPAVTVSANAGSRVNEYHGTESVSWQTFAETWSEAQAYAAISRTESVENRQAASIGGAVFASSFGVSVRCVLGGTPNASPSLPIAGQEISASKTLSASEAAALLAGQVVQISAAISVQASGT